MRHHAHLKKESGYENTAVFIEQLTKRWKISNATYFISVQQFMEKTMIRRTSLVLKTESLQDFRADPGLQCDKCVFTLDETLWQSWKTRSLLTQSNP